MDLGFLLDSSGSLEARYEDEKYFLKSLVNTFHMTDNNLQASVITFSSKTELSIKFSDYHDTASFNAAVDAIPLMGMQTRIDKALLLATSEMFTKKNGVRDGVSKMLVILTDGDQTGAVHPGDLVAPLEEAGVYIIVIGIGHWIHLHEVEHMSGKNGIYFTPDSFDVLISDEFISNVTSITCPGKLADTRFPQIILDQETSV